MAVPLSEWREQEARTEKMKRLAKLAVATVCIVGAASHWHDITQAISGTKTSPEMAVKTPPVSSHRQIVGPTSSSTEQVVKREVKAPEPVGFHRNSARYKSNPALEEALIKDHGAQKEVAKMISETYRVPLKTATLIVAKSVVESKTQQIDPFLVLALIGQESTYKKNAESPYGAQGLMQVVPRFHQVSMKKVGVQNILEAPIAKQIQLGTRVLKEFLGENKPVELALQHYNQGSSAIIDPNWKYAKGVLSKREELTATVANYVQENAPTYASLKPNL